MKVSANQIVAGGCVWPAPQKGTTLNKKDRANAKDLAQQLRDARPKQGGEVEFLRTQDGITRGPEGQPLVRVSLPNGRSAYVDPNTNQYYLSVRSPIVFRLVPGATPPVAVKGPYTLPQSARFTNSHFSDADVRALTALASPPRRPVELEIVKDGFGR